MKNSKRNLIFLITLIVLIVAIVISNNHKSEPQPGQAFSAQTLPEWTHSPEALVTKQKITLVPENNKTGGFIFQGPMDNGSLFVATFRLLPGTSLDTGVSKEVFDRIGQHTYHGNVHYVTLYGTPCAMTSKHLFDEYGNKNISDAGWLQADNSDVIISLLKTEDNSNKHFATLINEKADLTGKEVVMKGFQYYHSDSSICEITICGKLEKLPKADKERISSASMSEYSKYEDPYILRLPAKYIDDVPGLSGSPFFLSHNGIPTDTIVGIQSVRMRAYAMDLQTQDTVKYLAIIMDGLNELDLGKGFLKTRDKFQ